MIWHSDKDQLKKNSIIVYDNDMHFLKEVSNHELLNNDVYAIDFVNSKDSFQVIYQYLFKNDYYCKRMIFDDEARLKSSVIIDTISNVSIEDFYNIQFKVVANKSTGNFALLRFLQENKTSLDINYLFFDNNRHQNHYSIPFNFIDAQLQNLMLSANNNLVLSFTNKIENYSWVYFYKINLKDNAAENFLRRFSSGNIVNQTMHIVQNNEDYVVCAEWLDSLNNGIFLWQVSNSISKDTILDIHKIYTHLDNNTPVNILPFISLNHLHLFIANSFYQPGNSLRSQAAQPFTYAAPLGMGMDKLPSSVDREYSHQLDNYISAHIFSAASIDDESQKKASVNPELLDVFAVNLDKDFNIIDTAILKSSIDMGIKSFVNESSIFQSYNNFNLLFPQQVTSKKNAVGYIKFNANNTYSYNQLSLMHLKYQLKLSDAVQLNSQEVIIPSAYKNKMVFTKIEFK